MTQANMTHAQKPKEHSAAHATFTIERTYDVPPARVFAAWSDPKAKNRWFVEGDGWDIMEYQHDFRIGGNELGRFRRAGDSTIIVNKTSYDDIVANERIVFSYTMGREDVPFSASLATVELRPDGRGTRLVFTEQLAMLDPEEWNSAANREQGWSWLFDALGKELRQPINEKVTLN